ncbi:hypothetical protein ERN12_11540 [Rhodobacteraceae bacterium]|nr:hypothetical protein ERN12_11540 [Paracoccaceae bacterium]
MMHRVVALSGLWLLGLAACVPQKHTATDTIPLVFQGRWALTPADCEPGRADAKGLMVVDDTTLRFYESRGRLQQATLSASTQLQGTFDFNGEGQHWFSQETLTVRDTGQTLIREPSDTAALPDVLTYQRCAAAR